MTTDTDEEIVAAVLLGLEITEPGLYGDVPNPDYHADPVPGGSLSSSGARRIIPPGCPAKFRYEREHGRPPKAAFDLGHAAHKYVLGEGDALVVVDASDWRTKAAQQAKADAHAAGLVPLLAKDHDRVLAMADAILDHPTAAALFNPLGGQPEQSLFWRDPHTEVMCRGRLDWLPFATEDRRVIVPDYKTCAKGDPDTLQKTIASLGYHAQAAWYLDGLINLGIAGRGDPVFVFVFQETEAPYVVTVVEPDVNAMRIGRHVNRIALATYAECMRTDRWPGYADEPVLMALPQWVQNKYAEELNLL